MEEGACMKGEKRRKELPIFTQGHNLPRQLAPA
jgi:hypothetical protein